jgi:large subunit ribosomal protein L6
MAVLVEYKDDIPIPKGVTVTRTQDALTVKGPKGEVKKRFTHQKIVLKAEGGKVQVYCKLPSIKQKAMCGTWSAHVRNMLKGVTQGFEYELKILYAHFPIKAGAKGDEYVIENFLGERYPRTSRIMPGVKVTTKGDQVLVVGADREAVGQTAVNIELATRIRGFDPRVFQDGIYIVRKG